MAKPQKPRNTSQKSSPLVFHDDHKTRAKGAGQAYESAKSRHLVMTEVESRTPFHRFMRIGAIAVTILLVLVIAVWSSITYYREQNSPVTSGNLVTKLSDIYSTTYQNRALRRIESKKNSGHYDQHHMLVLLNPYDTNTTSAYVYFRTERVAKVSYTISAQDTKYPDFSAVAYQQNAYQHEHEFTVIGLIPSTRNAVTFTITYQDGTTEQVMRKYTSRDLLGEEAIKISAKTAQSGVQIQSSNTNISTTHGETNANAIDDSSALAASSMSSGLYAILGDARFDQRFLLFYDANGVLRAEIPLNGYQATRLLFSGGVMYYASANNQISAMDRLGRLVNIYNLPSNYTLYNDFAFDSDGNIVAIATDKTDTEFGYAAIDQGSAIIQIDIHNNGSVKKLVDLRDVLKKYRTQVYTTVSKKVKSVDWLQLNSIQWMPNGSILLSSRETSSLISISNLESTPKLNYVVGPSELWNSFGYTKQVYSRSSDFHYFAGQSNVSVERTADLSEGQYYVTMLNNNYAHSSTLPDFDWDTVTPYATTSTNGKAHNHSRFSRYLIDEKTNTFTLVSSFTVPYSSTHGDAQRFGNTILATVSNSGSWALYTTSGKLLRRYTVKPQLSVKTLYRVMAYDMQGYWFADANAANRLSNIPSDSSSESSTSPSSDSDSSASESTESEDDSDSTEIGKAESAYSTYSTSAIFSSTPTGGFDAINATATYGLNTLIVSSNFLD